MSEMCRYGRHLRTEANTGYEASGWRRCRDCRREQKARERKGGRLSPSMGLADRINHYTDRSSSAGCWLWTSAVTSRGYPVIQWQGQALYVHRAVLELALDEPLGERFACHRCDVKRCVNPAHLYAGDHAQNMRDMVERGRVRNGHTGPIGATA